MTLIVLRQTGETNAAIAARLGITEGAVRYHLKRQAAQASDGRGKSPLIEQLQLTEVVDHWWNDQLASLGANRPPNVHQLWTYLVDQYSYDGSYKSVRKFVRQRFPAPAKRPFRRIETPPAAQVQSDWLETKVRLLAVSSSGNGSGLNQDGSSIPDCIPADLGSAIPLALVLLQ